MLPSEETPEFLRFRASQHERGSTRLVQIEMFALITAIVTLAIRHGLRQSSDQQTDLLGILIVIASLMISVSCITRYRWSLRRSSFLKEHWAKVSFAGLFFVGSIFVFSMAHRLPFIDGPAGQRFEWLYAYSEGLILILGLLQSLSVSRAYASKGINPALLLVGSFVVLVTIGTFLLMLPRARAVMPGVSAAEGAPFTTALFTATSASCVTGLIVEPTGTYWSRFGQSVILVLFQIGGLGIMTFGALFIALAGRHLQVQETATLRKLLDSDRLADVRQLLITILIFTFTAEIVGAFLMAGLWPNAAPSEQAFQAIFHSVSAFCNAGFSLTEDSFVGMADRWQIWFVVSGLIVVGGLGFGVVFNLYRVLHTRIRGPEKRSAIREDFFTQTRLSLTSRLVLCSSVSLLVIGTLGFVLLESFASTGEDYTRVAWSDAWFQSVSFRTAGFNTVDLGELQTTTKLLAIGMMFIGASPGSTGGGIKTISISLVLLSIFSLLKGKDRVEVGHRRIPASQIQRAFLVVTSGLFIVMVTTFLLVLFEAKPAQLIDHLFEATSAFATVGLSTGITAELTTPSRIVIVLTMFIGRVGPLTLLLALAGKQKRPTYDFPEERVALG
ncbi:MAG: potassium transporter TrkG [Planctomycetaceae bacterium]|nr:potassium transporter TrkG [Planctomycetaceae bacterium]